MTVTTKALPGSVEYWAGHAPTATALCELDQQLTFGEWNKRSDRLAAFLSQVADCKDGSHIAVCMSNCLSWFVAQAAAAKLGAALVPVSPRLTPAEIHYIVADSGAQAFIFDDDRQDALARVWTNTPAAARGRVSQVRAVLSTHRPKREDVAWLETICTEGAIVERYSTQPPRSVVYTSGTTGQPRGVVSGRTNTEGGEHDSSRRKGGDEKPTSTAPADRRQERNLLGAPLNHAAGQGSARATLSGGGCVYIMPRFDAELALTLIERERITTTFLVPTMLNRIMNLPEETLSSRDISSLKVLITGASPCPQALKEAVIAYFGSHCLIEGYGTTEVGVVARMYPDDHLRKPFACGKLQPGVLVNILDEALAPVAEGEVGEIYVRSPFMIQRYLNEPPPQELVDGFFATGDMGRFDGDGYLYVLDRKKDMIIAGGVNIYPAEVEEVLRQHPAVLDAAVYGVPDPDLGEQVRAAVECISGKTVHADELLTFAAAHLAKYKCPRAVDIVAEIPRNAAGKVLKTQLRAPHWAGHSRRI